MADSFSFQAKVASRGYHVYKETTWRNAMENEKDTVAIESNEASKQIDPYYCAVQIKSGESAVTVGHIPRETSWHCYFFLKEKGREINGNVFSTTYRLSPIPLGGLDIPLVLRFQSPKYATQCKMKKFAQTLHNYKYTSIKADYSDEEPEEEICFSVEEGNMNEKSSKK